MKLHHTAIVTHDLDAAVGFYRDGLGMEVTLDIRPEGDFTTLFGAHSDRLHSVFLADPADESSGIVELVEFDDVSDSPQSPSEHPSTGFFLISFYVDLDEVVPRLARLGHAVEREIAIDSHRGGAVRMATLHDPDGVLVELIDAG